MSQLKSRLWELDFLRGIAIILMILNHLIFDLGTFYDFPVSNVKGLWLVEGRIAAFLFIALVGILTVVLSQSSSDKIFRQKNLHRAVRLLILGLTISLVTWLTYPTHTIWFGILHFLGVSILILPFFLRFHYLNLVFAALFFILGRFLSMLEFSHPFGLPLGMKPIDYASFDYYPLLPWFSMVLMGVFFGQLLYPNAQPLISRPPRHYEKIFNGLGRYSLWIYMLHQIPLLFILWLIFG